jgi:hypothetical protein
MHAPLDGVSTTPIILILACCHAKSILISSPNTLAPFVVSFVHYYTELSPLPCHHPLIYAIISTGSHQGILRAEYSACRIVFFAIAGCNKP